VILTTERLVLREFIEDDWEAVMVYQQKPEYLKYYDWIERSPDDVREFVKMFLDQQQADPRIKYQLAVTLRTSGQLIGNCGIRTKSAGAHQADIGFELDLLLWGQGYATEAAWAILQFGFEELHLHRVWSWCIADNLGSRRVLEKLGMKQEGRLRENESFKGRYWDTLIYAILEKEWRAKHDNLSG